MKEGIHVIAKKIDADVRDLINAIDRPEKFYRTFPLKGHVKDLDGSMLPIIY